MAKRKVKCKKEDINLCDEVIVKHYYVCKGKTITSKKGLLLSGMIVCADDLGGGQSSIDALLTKCCIELR